MVFGTLTLSLDLTSGLTWAGGEGFPPFSAGVRGQVLLKRARLPFIWCQVGWAQLGWGCHGYCFTVGLPSQNQLGEFPGDPPGWAFSRGRALGGPGNIRAEPGLGFPRGPT